jgi:hypothetical protein
MFVTILLQNGLIDLNEILFVHLVGLQIGFYLCLINRSLI